MAYAVQRPECVEWGRVGSALANERVQNTTAGQIVLKPKTPWRDGATHLLLSPLEFIQQPAALVATWPTGRDV